LLESLTERTAEALRSGAQQPIATARMEVEQAGIEFLVHVVTRIERKHRALDEQQRSGTNPFLPHDPDLFVGDISATHLAVLNRFNVLRHHLLIITREFEDQLVPLTRADFEALWVCLGDLDGLGFYNAGTVAGASQAHKHLQLIPTPLGSGPERTPIDWLLRELVVDGVVESTPHFRFRHAVTGIAGLARAPATEAAPALHAIYLQLLAASGCRPGQPYNLLATREWMLVVPRECEHCEGISINALGFAGSLLVRDHAQLDLVRRVGPLTMLESVAAR
jgi:ATP adenylyltransferase